MRPVVHILAVIGARWSFEAYSNEWHDGGRNEGMGGWEREQEQGKQEQRSE